MEGLWICVNSSASCASRGRYAKYRRVLGIEVAARFSPHLHAQGEARAFVTLGAEQLGYWIETAAAVLLVICLAGRRGELRVVDLASSAPEQGEDLAGDVAF